MPRRRTHDAFGSGAEAAPPARPDQARIQPSQAQPVWHGPAIGLMDLDAFFASVEQLDHPEWRGKPVIVGGSPDRRGVVSTASYEAREYGVHSAMPSFQARRLCPQAIWVTSNFGRYREISDRVMSVLLDETPLVEQVSIDEAFFDITPGRFANESPVEICRRIQRRVAEIGVTCSIGLGTNKTVAKIASEREKPRGMTVVAPGNEASFLAPLPVRALSGIGGATEKSLLAMNIRTLGDLARQDTRFMERYFGVSGPRMVLRASGREHSVVKPAVEHEDPKSVSNERTFARDLVSRKELEAAIGHVSEKVGARMRAKGLKGSQVTLKLKFDTIHTHTAQRQLRRATNNEHVFAPVACELLDGLWHEGTPVRLVGVGLSGFDETTEQLSLFDSPEETDDKQSLAEVTDRLRERFGRDALTYGRDFRL
ncbi:MAG: DNA polymerase IV [Atopobiaceae bacterium]|nr:DNA polymerase IV [Atopobiaceae bacterium]